MISLKINQDTLHEDVQVSFEKKPKNTVFSHSMEHDKGHGRDEDILKIRFK